MSKKLKREEASLDQCSDTSRSLHRSELILKIKLKNMKIINQMNSNMKNELIKIMMKMRKQVRLISHCVGTSSQI